MYSTYSTPTKIGWIILTAVMYIYPITCDKILHNKEMSYMIDTTSQMFLSNADQSYEIIFFKKLPIENIHKLQLKSCMCFSNRTITMDQCQENVRLKMAKTLQDIYLQQVKLYDADSNPRINKRQAEWLLNSLGLLGMTYWNHKQDNRINNLEEIAMDNSNNIGILSHEVRNNKKAILLLHKTNVENFKRVDQEICRWREVSRISVINWEMIQILQD